MRRTVIIGLSTLGIAALASGAWAAPARAVPLKASISGPTSAIAGSAVTFSLAKTTVPAGDTIAAYSLNYGDGTKKVAGKGRQPNTERHSFSKPGSYTVKLSITDATKKTSAATAKITVRAVPVPGATSAPVAPAAAMTTSPAITSIVDPIAAGSVETVTATGNPNDSCDLEVFLPSGRQSTEPGLGAKTADSTGAVSWTWKITSNTGAGTATAHLTCGAGSVDRAFTIN